MAGEIYLNDDGMSVQLTALHTVAANRVAVVSNWLGISRGNAESGDIVALAVDKRSYQFKVPASFDPAVGDLVYIEVADVTGHYPDDTAWGTSAGSGKVALCKVVVAKNSDNWIIGKLVLDI